MDLPDENQTTAPAGGWITQAWLVLALALMFGAALAAVHVHLREVIAANKLNETLQRIPELIWGYSPEGQVASPPGEVRIRPAILTISKSNQVARYSLYRVDQSTAALRKEPPPTENATDEPVGWVVKARGQGYAGQIEALIGLSARLQTITGIFILDQKETPGLGSRITALAWRHGFAGQSTATRLVLDPKGAEEDVDGAIDAITGATISSHAVVTLVNRTINDIKGKLTPQSVIYTTRHPL